MDLTNLFRQSVACLLVGWAALMLGIDMESHLGASLNLTALIASVSVWQLASKRVSRPIQVSFGCLLGGLISGTFSRRWTDTPKYCPDVGPISLLAGVAVALALMVLLQHPFAARRCDTEQRSEG